GCRPVDAEADRRARRLKLLGAALARREHHVRGRAVAYAHAGAPEATDLVIVEMDAVRDPRTVAHPADLLEVVDWSAGELLLAIGDLVAGFAKVSVHPAFVTRGEPCGLGHQPLRRVEGRTRRERHLGHGALVAVVPARDHPLAVVENFVSVLYRTRNCIAALLYRQIERAPGQSDAQTQNGRLLGLNVHRLLEACRIEILMI